MQGRLVLHAAGAIAALSALAPSTSAWVPLLDHLSKADADLMGVLALAVDPQAPDRLYATCGTYTGEWARRAALLASTEGGRSWRLCEEGWPADRSTVFLAPHGRGVVVDRPGSGA